MLQQKRFFHLFAITSITGSILWTILSILIFPAPSNQAVYAVPQQGFYAPDFSLTALTGESYQLSEFQGKAVLVNIWASWCTPCQAEMPAIQAMADKYKGQNFVVLAVNATSQDNLDNVIGFVEEQQLTFPILLDQNGFTVESYQVQALPSTFFITPDGIINEIVIGGPMSEALLETRILSILEK